MPRSRATATRQTLETDWAFFGELCRALAVHVSRAYQPEVVVGIAKAGVVPAAIVATILDCGFGAMVVTRASDEDQPELVTGPPVGVAGKRVLLVDETCDTGDTFKVALHSLAAIGPSDVRTAVSFRTGVWEPDFFAFETDKAIVLPWDRAIVKQG